ncbi:LacI family DNA-binding transcriptional regulator [Beijerinckia indica]|uniref:Transcriptional regulator, LacI family n=1 Tax=Beijerinckia indica subsp. indica (strain ATCC 9039 / DSM 1715 / NCIMB 8712) TaxID=395963 RepID=B2IFR3_BEII9|nr:LacI family DNA-binding transcriptional regulator [Beijerinckia indica]ACB94274.1 transcriptional regulator, LacI family [Beijerinckia indica subsp. indica ATCC 9039]
MSNDRQKRRVSLIDVAQAAGVSRATASLVLRESPLVAAETRKRVRKAMTKLGYIYNRGAANMRRNRSGSIGLLLCNIGSPFYAELMAGIDQVMDAQDIVSLLANSVESPERQFRQLHRLREYNVDGIVLCPAAGTSADLLDELNRLSLPCVQTLRYLSPKKGDYVGADYEFGVEQAVEHLVRNGRRRIAFIGGNQLHSAARERLSGFRRALHRHGLSHDLILPTNLTSADGAEALDALLSRDNPADAAICYNDMVALGVTSRLLSKGLHPGAEFAVIGTDDLPNAATAWPALTTIATNPRAVGEAAARLLLRRIEQPDGTEERILLPPKLIIRDSCGGRTNTLERQAS